MTLAITLYAREGPGAALAVLGIGAEAENVVSDAAILSAYPQTGGADKLIPAWELVGVGGYSGERSLSEWQLAAYEALARGDVSVAEVVHLIGGGGGSGGPAGSIVDIG